MSIGIYKITSPSGKIYIGQSINIERRWIEHKNLTPSNFYNNCIKLKNSLKKYGSLNHTFEIIEECLIEQLNEKERYWQEYYNSVGKKGLNLKFTKTNDRSGYFSEETKQKMKKPKSNEHKEKLKNKIITDITKQKMSLAKKGNKSHFGHKHSEETKQIISEKNKISLKGIKQSNETRLKRSESSKGRIHSKESNEKRSKSLKGRIVSEKRKQIVSEKLKGKRYKPVLQFDKQGNFIKEWNGPTSIELELGIKSVGQVCNKKLKTSGGFIWEWKI